MLICACTIIATALQSSNVSANEKLEELAQRVGVRILAEATSDRDVLAICKSQIPYSRMSPRSRQRASYIISNLSQYRRMPSLQYEVKPGIYQYLINHPDVAISTWRVMGISKLQMFQTGEFEYEASAADGSKGIADILWRDGNQCLFIVKGTYSSPLLPGAIDASALVWLRYRFVKSRDGKVLVNQQVETFISFPSHAVDTLARLATMVTNTILDRNVFEVSLYARMMSTAASKEPEWITQVAKRMDGVLPQRATELVRVSRGQNPVVESVSSSASRQGERRTVGLPRSGAFHAFEDSMSQIKSHAPLGPPNMNQLPSDGKPVVTAQQDHGWRARKSDPAGPGMSVTTIPAAIPPASDPESAEEVADLPGLAYSSQHSDTGADQKSVMGGVPITPSGPLLKSDKTVSARTRRSVSAKPVSVSKSVPSGNNGQMLPAAAIAMPPVPPGGGE